MNKLLKTLLYVSVLATALSCAKESTEDTSGIQDEILNAWVQINHPEKLSQLTKSGSYILELEQGTGGTVTDTGYVFVHYIKRDLEGNITETNIEKYSDQLGSYYKSYDYGCDIWQVGVGAVYSGVEDMLKTLRVGGHATIAVPGSAAVCEYDLYDAFPADNGTSFIMELHLEQVEEDIYAYQEKLLKEYSALHFGGADTTSQGFYFIDQTPDGAETDTISDGSTVNVWYIGRRLDGSVFDTNIQDTAKKYRIYDADASYDALEITWKKDVATMLEEASVVSGFGMAVNKMNFNSSATTFFWSKLGYGISGQNPKIGEYSPMAFTLTIKPEK